MADEDSDPMGGPQNAKTNPRYNWTTPQLPNIPDTPPQTPFVIDMNYLMPFSVMLMILCVLLLILCYLRHRMRQRRMLQRELRLSQLLHQSGAPVCHGRLDGESLDTQYSGWCVSKSRYHDSRAASSIPITCCPFSYGVITIMMKPLRC